MPKSLSDSAAPSTNRWAANQTRDPGRQRVRVFHAGHQEGSSFGCTATLGVRGFEFSVRAGRRVCFSGAPRSWVAEGSSFPRWASRGFAFWVHRDHGRRRVRVLGAKRPWATEGSSFPRGRTEGFEFCVRCDPGRQRVRVFRAGHQDGSSFACAATLCVRGFNFPT